MYIKFVQIKGKMGSVTVVISPGKDYGKWELDHYCRWKRLEQHAKIREEWSVAEFDDIMITSRPLLGVWIWDSKNGAEKSLVDFLR